jgi:signal transduction histidine kinase
VARRRILATQTATQPPGERLGRARVGIRARSVGVTLLGVVAAMLLGGAGLVFVLEDNLETTATATAEARAREVGDLITTTGLTEATATILAEARSGQLVQIIDPDHRVLASSTRGLSAAPMVELFPAVGTSSTAEATALLDAPGEWAVVARGVSARDQTYTVQVAIPITAERAAVRSVARYLILVTPLLLAGVALAVWLLVGRALGPVERIRREVAAIDSTDLTRRVQVPSTADEIASLARTMNGMLDRLDRADRAQRSFVSDASHELRSPLATLTAAAELAGDADGPRRERLMATIGEELVRISALVDDLMTLARADAADSRVQLEDVDLDDLVDGHRRRLQMTSGLEVSAAVQPARVVGDPQLLDQALRNVIDNAARHARTAVRLTVGQDGRTAVVQIDNDGPIIAAGDRERVFERFVRLDESRSRDAGGSGLGLAISRTSIDRHGGSLQVVDTADGWCRFEIRLPIGDAD